MDSDKPKICLGMPGYGSLTAGAARGFFCASQGGLDIDRQFNQGSLLAQNFNALWCWALNKAASGDRVDGFAMQHADVSPEMYWLDKLWDELVARDLDVLGVVVPIKNQSGMTSIALGRDDGDNWRPHCRLTMDEVHRLPETFTEEDTGYPLLLNTGLWVARFDLEWASKVHFTINDRIEYSDEHKRYVPNVEPEDWFFSRLCNELGLEIGATRKVAVEHQGDIVFTNTCSWGTEKFDSEYVSESTVPDRELLEV